MSDHIYVYMMEKDLTNSKEYTECIPWPLRSEFKKQQWKGRSLP